MTLPTTNATETSARRRKLDILRGRQAVVVRNEKLPSFLPVAVRATTTWMSL
jgi:hypothetical protein